MSTYTKKDIKGEFGEHVMKHVNKTLNDMFVDLGNRYFGEANIVKAYKFYKPEIYTNKVLKKLFTKDGIYYDRNEHDTYFLNYTFWGKQNIWDIEDKVEKTVGVSKIYEYDGHDKQKLYVIKDKYDFLTYEIKVRFDKRSCNNEPYVWMMISIKGDFDEMLKTLPAFKKANNKFYDMTNAEISLNDEVIYTYKDCLIHGFVTSIGYNYVIVDDRKIFLYPNYKNLNIVIINSKMNFKGMFI